MNDLAKKILGIAAKHPKYDQNLATEELKKMQDLDVIEGFYNTYQDIDKNIERDNPRNSALAYYMGICDPPARVFDLEKRRTYGRSGFPDVDMDFDYLLRYKIVDYIIDKYGRDYVGNIGTVQKLKIKAAVRRAIKILDPADSVRFDKEGKIIKDESGQSFALENEVLNTLPKLMKRPDGSFVETVEEAAQEYPEFGKFMKAYPEVYRVACRIKGTISSFGSHAAGIVVSPIPLAKIAPLHVTTVKAAGGGKRERVIATQFGMEVLEELGLIKFDVLGLATLTAVSMACVLIKEEYGANIDWKEIPLDDKKTLALLSSGRTDGCFQLENHGMKQCLRMIGIDSFDDLVVAVAMYRPGPKDYIPEFAGRKAGNISVSYPHPLLENITKRTWGIICYQEQVMQAFMVLADLTASDGYDFMKGCAKKKIDKIEKYKEKFLKGTKAQGIPQSVVKKIWADLYKFSGYAFNKSLQWNQKITTTKQEYSIQKLYNMKQRGEELPQVFSPSGEPVDIVDVYDHGVLPVYEITFEDGSVVSSTLNHKFMTQNGVLPLRQILTENLKVIQNTEVNNEEQKMDMQRLSRQIRNPSSNVFASEELQRVSKGKIQSQGLCLSGLRTANDRIQEFIGSQKSLSTLEKLEERALQRAKQKKWGKGVGANFSKPSTAEGMETENQRIGTSGGEYSRREKTSVRLNEGSQQETLCTISAKQSSNSDQNIGSTGCSEGSCGSAKEMERRESGGFFSKMYRQPREESLEIKRRIVSTRNFGAIGIQIQSICLQRRIQNQVSSSSGGFYLEEPQDSRGIRRRTTFSTIFSERSKKSTTKGSAIQYSYDKSRLSYNSHLLRHVAFQQEAFQISAIPRIVDSSPVLFGKRSSQNNWKSLQIQKVKFLGYEQCYDLEVVSDDHLYCLANGVVNSNSHSVSYAYESYKTAYLKAHYTTAFMAARLTVESVRRNFDDVEKYEKDAQKFGIEILPPTLNESKLHYSIAGDKSIRRTILVKGVGDKAAEEIVKHQPYTGKDLLYDFAMRTGPAATVKVIEAMKDGGLWPNISKKKLIDGFEKIRADKKRSRGRPIGDMFE